ncbi:MAG: hypothetical protein EA397_11150 [Deltaproteobacteria bacterium]|nr:MAG: hypothetical protein EA397_11150 [Deltaproteobacteria bacterium]
MIQDHLFAHQTSHPDLAPGVVPDEIARSPQRSGNLGQGELVGQEVFGRGAVGLGIQAIDAAPVQQGQRGLEGFEQPQVNLGHPLGRHTDEESSIARVSDLPLPAQSDLEAIFGALLGD